ncbi:hypothetical protein B0T16DRAFT_391251 [Cercophora newfieldiana]|uniref:Uncharacterized protein n=1 Tax=Cercophora newfieldiana TaxID=92897 RepID=A0AA40CQG4_9PEZI|nr:hypothetical protein B0T16DRAFT_391251 [Cercophora newfieldiana]
MAFFPLSQGGFTTPAPACSDADDLLRAIVDTGNRLSEVSARLQPTAARSSRTTIDRLERAMMKAYNVAVFIRGNFDNHEHDQSELDDLLEQTVDAFQEAHEIATAGLRKLGDYHALAVETADPMIKHAREEIVRLRQHAIAELGAFQGQFDAARKSADQAYRNIRMESQAYQRAQHRYEGDLQKCANGTLIGGPFGVLVDARREVEEVGQSLSESQRVYSELQDLIQTLKPQRKSLRIQLCQTEYLSAVLPSLEAASNATQSHGLRLQTQLSRLKDTVARLARRASDLQECSDGFSKDEYAMALLEICRKVLIDPALGDEVRIIRNEIVNGYGGNIPVRIKGVVDVVDDLMKAMFSAPSICGEIRETM